MTEKKPDSSQSENRGYQPTSTAPRVNPQDGYQPTTGSSTSSKPPSGGSSVSKK